MSGVLNHPPQRIIQELLITLGGLISDPNANGEWPCYVGVMPDAPDEVVCVTDTVGKVHGRVHVTGLMHEKYGIQIKVRSTGPVDGYVKSARILQRLNAIVNPIDVTVLDEEGTASSDYRIQSVTPTSPVIRLGTERPQSKRYLWTLNSIVSMQLIP